MTALNFPASPSDGDTFDNYIYDGTKAVWRIQPNIPDISSKFQVSATAPTNPVNGEVWLNSTDGNTYIYYVDADSSQWIEIGGSTAPPPNISDLNDVEIYEALDGQTLVYDSASDQWVNGEGSTVPVIISETAPVSPEVGELWLNSTEAKMYVYYDDGTSAQWVAAVGGTVPSQGKILQVVSTTKTDAFSTPSTSFTGVTGLSATITPSSTSSKIYAMLNMSVSNSGSAANQFRLVRNSTPLGVSSAGSTYNGFYSSNLYNFGNIGNDITIISFNYLDSPNSVVSITYSAQCSTTSNVLYVNRPGANATYGGSSTITLMEVAG